MYLFFLRIGMFLLGCLILWMAVWGANLTIYLLSIPFNFIEEFIAASSETASIILNIVTKAPVYFMYLWVGLKYCFIPEESKTMQYLRVITFSTLIVSICDVRILQDSSGIIHDVWYFFKDTLNCFIIGGPDWISLDLSGDNVPAGQYTTFDISVGLAALFHIILILTDYDYKD